ncbi:AraC family transcriptional regulator [Cryptosporangium arvum]|uniref:DNA-binding domain-containing protein, AraC-type n=1 Tax=Cryptosporangium arvum DSM 44712 TaxID=927661 RepID=A0A010ZTA7_9ACTN|nr:AraC family transcriptional regulator [Cryptosporangium arvum]EXG81939.1 DNA-binding domain-containing protein, AraC-type [Cryptosporangium arvum DSM 44712]
MDPVTEVLRLSGLKGTVGTRIEAGSRWSAEVSGHPGIATHAVLSGGASLVTDDGRHVDLAAGDVVMLPIGAKHRLGDDPGGEPVPIPARGGAGQCLRLGSGPPRTRIFTVYYDCNHVTRTQVLDELPDFLHVEGGEPGAAYLDDVVRLLGRELSHPQLATTAVVDSLVDLILIQLVRAWLARQPEHRRGGWLGWADDPIVRDAVERVHADPAGDWSAATLAAALNVSRATLARRFQAAMGRSPAAYVTQWRMDLAASRLRDTRDPVEAVAARVGYRSVPSFTRAFLRDRGTTPGAFRRQRQKP